MSKRGNGAENPVDGQTALDLEQEAPPPVAGQEAATQAAEQEASERDASESAEAAANAVTELGNTQDGCWKVLAHGERVDISDKEWRKELTRLLATSLTTP